MVAPAIRDQALSFPIFSILSIRDWLSSVVLGDLICCPSFCSSRHCMCWQLMSHRSRGISRLLRIRYSIEGYSKPYSHALSHVLMSSFFLSLSSTSDSTSLHRQTRTGCTEGLPPLSCLSPSCLTLVFGSDSLHLVRLFLSDSCDVETWSLFLCLHVANPCTYSRGTSSPLDGHPNISPLRVSLRPPYSRKYQASTYSVHPLCCSIPHVPFRVRHLNALLDVVCFASLAPKATATFRLSQAIARTPRRVNGVNILLKPRRLILCFSYFFLFLIYDTLKVPVRRHSGINLLMLNSRSFPYPCPCKPLFMTKDKQPKGEGILRDWLVEKALIIRT